MIAILIILAFLLVDSGGWDCMAFDGSCSECLNFYKDRDFCISIACCSGTISPTFFYSVILAKTVLSLRNFFCNDLSSNGLKWLTGEDRCFCHSKERLSCTLKVEKNFGIYSLWFRISAPTGAPNPARPLLQ